MALENFLRDVDILWDRVGKSLHERPDALVGRKMRVQVVNASIVEDLTGYALNLGWKSMSDETKFGLDAFTVVDATKGIFELEYTSGMLSNYGSLRGTLQLVPPVGNTVESNNFGITVKKSAIDSEAIQSETSFTALTMALVSVQNLESTYAPELLSVKQQLAETATKAELSAIATPKAVSLIAQMTDVAKIYVYTGAEGGYITGNWYYHNGSGWVTGGVYQATNIANNAVTKDMTQFILKSANMFDVNSVITGYTIDGVTGTLVANSTFSVSDPIEIESGSQYTIKKSTVNSGRYAWSDSADIFISSSAILTAKETATITAPVNAKYIRCVSHNADLGIYQLNKGNVALAYDKYRLIFDREIKLPIENTGILLNYTGGLLTKIKEDKLVTTVNYDSSGNLLSVVESSNGDTIQTVLNYTSGALTSVSRTAL